MNAPSANLKLSDTDRLFLAGCLVRGLAEESILVDAAEYWLRFPHLSLVKIILEREIIDRDDWQEFARAIDHSLTEQPPSHERDRHIKELADSTVALLTGRIKSVWFWAALQGEDLQDSLDSIVAASVTYRLERIIGQGGIGRVWLARDDQLGRPLAIKELRPDRDRRGATRRRFLREAQISSQLMHPNVVPFYHFGTGRSGHHMFLAMQYVTGQSLAEVLKATHGEVVNWRQRRFELSRLLTILLKIGDALSFAHSRGFIHRDLKPENIQVGDFGEAHVLDWGLAKQVGTEAEDFTDEARAISDGELGNLYHLTDDGQILGSLPYMAPEQAAGRQGAITFRTDVFGLGGILFTILTGKSPHQHHAGTNQRNFARLVFETPVPPVRTLNASVPPALAAICDRALAFDPEDRYPSIAAFQEDINHWMSGDPVKAYHEPLLERTVRAIKRRPRMLQGLLVFTVVLVISAASAVAFSFFEGISRQDRTLRSLSTGCHLLVSAFAEEVESVDDSASALAKRIPMVVDETGKVDGERFDEAADFLFAIQPSVDQIALLDAQRHVLVRKLNNLPNFPDLVDVPPEIASSVNNESVVWAEVAMIDGEKEFLLRGLAPVKRDGGGEIRYVAISVDLGPELREVLAPLLRDTGLRMMITNNDNTVIAKGDYLDGPRIRFGNFGTFDGKWAPTIEAYLNTPRLESPDAVTGWGGNDHLVAAAKLPLDPPHQRPQLGVVLAASVPDMLQAPSDVRWRVIALILGSAVLLYSGVVLLRPLVRPRH